jgi:hypothetical protein
MNSILAAGDRFREIHVPIENVMHQMPKVKNAVSNFEKR